MRVSDHLYFPSPYLVGVPSPRLMYTFENADSADAMAEAGVGSLHNATLGLILRKDTISKFRGEHKFKT